MPLINFLKKHEKNIYIFVCIVLFLFSSLAIIKSAKSHYSFVSYPYQLEYREGGALNATQLFLDDRNPYSLNEQPQNTYVYGFVYPLAVTPFAQKFGNTLFVHRSFVYFFILATCLLVFYVLIKKRVNFVFAFAAVILLHQSIINAANTAIARPDGLGIFLFTFALVIPWRWKFSRVSLGISIALGILGYLTKPYYVLAIPIIALYLFIFVSKRKSLVYAITACIFLMISVAVASVVFPVYINNALLSHINASVYLYNTMKDQVAEYVQFNFFLIIIIFLSVIMIVGNFLKNHLSETVEKAAEYFRSLLKLNSNRKLTADEPLINSKLDLFFIFTLLSVLFVFIVKLGGHNGNWHAAYLFHLASPSLIIVTFVLLEKASNKILQSFTAVLIIITMNTEFKTPEYEFARYADCFEKVEDAIRKSKNTYNSPEIVSIMVSENKPVYNSGLSEYFLSEEHKSDKLIESSRELVERREEYQKEVNAKISGKEFDLILLSGNYYTFFVNKNLLKQYYELSGTFCAPFIYHEMTIEKWVPKK